MKVTLNRIGKLTFDGLSGSGHHVTIDGAPKHGGTDEGIRPMEMLLMSLAGCSAMDVVLFVEKMRQPLDDLRITVEGQRKEAIPAVFEDIHVHFEAVGAIDPGRFQHAVDLSMEKYCSAAAMLREVATVRWTADVVAA